MFMSMLHVPEHVACPCQCCMPMSSCLSLSMLHLHVHARAACPCPLSMLHDQVHSARTWACSMDMDIQLGHRQAAWKYKRHGHYYVYIDIVHPLHYVDTLCVSMSMLHANVHDTCPLPMSMIHALVHVTCPCRCCMPMSLLHVCVCSINMNMQHGYRKAAWTWICSTDVEHGQYSMDKYTLHF